MAYLFAHAGHSHETVDMMSSASGTALPAPIVIGIGVAVVLLLVAVVYFLMKRQPKKSAKQSKDTLED